MCLVRARQSEFRFRAAVPDAPASRRGSLLTRSRSITRRRTRAVSRRQSPRRRPATATTSLPDGIRRKRGRRTGGHGAGCRVCRRHARRLHHRCELARSCCIGPLRARQQLTARASPQTAPARRRSGAARTANEGVCPSRASWAVRIASRRRRQPLGLGPASAATRPPRSSPCVLRPAVATNHGRRILPKPGTRCQYPRSLFPSRVCPAAAARSRRTFDGSVRCRSLDPATGPPSSRRSPRAFPGQSERSTRPSLTATMPGPASSGRAQVTLHTWCPRPTPWLCLRLRPRGGLPTGPGHRISLPTSRLSTRQ